jgi:hypothetical protein
MIPLELKIRDAGPARPSIAAKEPPAVSTGTLSPAEAVADIRELRQGVTLGGLRIKDLVDEGRRY